MTLATLERRSMRPVLWLFAACVLTTSLGCWPGPDRNAIHVTGTVRYFDLEGGFWAIRGDDNVTYDPVSGLSPEYQKDGLRVELDAKARPDVVSTHMVGTMVEITKIRRL